ncbi:hypothetical protein ACTXT7_001052 [Hymenolepis weldensis]
MPKFNPTRLVPEPTLQKQHSIPKSCLHDYQTTKICYPKDRRKIVVLLPPAKLLIRPSRSSLQNVLVSATTSDLNQTSFRLRSDQHWWMIHAKNSKKCKKFRGKPEARLHFLIISLPQPVPSLTASTRYLPKVMVSRNATQYSSTRFKDSFRDLNVPILRSLPNLNGLDEQLADNVSSDASCWCSNLDALLQKSTVPVRNLNFRTVNGYNGVLPPPP